MRQTGEGYDGSVQSTDQLGGLQGVRNGEREPTLEDKYLSMISGDTRMKFKGVTSTGNAGGFREDGGPADIKKTFIYNQKLTTSMFQVLDDHPQKS